MWDIALISSILAAAFAILNIAIIVHDMKVSTKYSNLCIKYDDLDHRYMRAREEIQRLQFMLRHQIYTEDVWSPLHNSNDSTQDDVILDALKLAVKTTHPDNGGNSDDFIRFKRAYDKYSK